MITETFAHCKVFLQGKLCMQLCRNIGHFLVCVRPFALHRQQTENDKQNVDFAPPTKSSAGAYGYRPRANQSGTD